LLATGAIPVARTVARARGDCCRQPHTTDDHAHHEVTIHSRASLESSKVRRPPFSRLRAFGYDGTFGGSEGSDGG